VVRAALFALVGLVFLAHWLVTDPSYEMSDSQDEWNHVLAFSAVILSLAAAIPMFAKLVHGWFAFRGLGMGWAFFAFILGTAILLLGLSVLTVVIALGGRGGRRLLALVPAGTIAAIIFYVIAGGPLMLATWLAAAALALALPARTVVEATPTAP